MKAKHLIITSGVILGGVWLAHGASALTYQDTEEIQFTFNPTLQLSVGSNNIAIDNLAPGTAGTSGNVDANGADNGGGISVTVTTNNATGYELSASVGTTLAPYNGTSLVHSTTTSATANSAATNKFQSLADNASISGYRNITSGYWGYAIDDSATYSGLPYGSTKLLKQKGTSVTSGETTYFRIGANAPDGMMSGDYTNTIVFQAVSKVNSGS